MKDIIINDCEDCAIAAVRLMAMILKDFTGLDQEKAILKEKAKDLFDIILDYFNNIEVSYSKKKHKEEGKLKDSLSKLRDMVTVLNDIVKPYMYIMQFEIEKIIEKQIELISGMKKAFKESIGMDQVADTVDEIYEQADIEQLLNYLYIIRFLIEMEASTPANNKDGKDSYFVKDIIIKHNQMLFKRILFIIKLNVQYDEVKEHSFICLSRIISVSSKDFESLIIKKFKILFDEKIFIGEGIRSLLTLNKGYTLIITFINLGKSSGKFTRGADQKNEYASYLIIKLLNIIQNISGARSETTKKALETLSDFIEGLSNEFDKDLLIAIIESFAYQFETLRKKSKAIYQYLKESELRKKEMNDYTNNIFKNHLKKNMVEVVRPPPPNIYEENLILSGNVGIFIEWDNLEEFTSKLQVVVKLIITCLTTTVAKLSQNKTHLEETDMKHLIKLFRKGIKLILEMKMQLTKDLPDADGEIYDILKNFVMVFLKLPIHSFTKLYTELAEFIIKQYLQLKSPANVFLLNVSVQIRDEKKVEKSLEYTIRYACCLFNQLIKDYPSLVKQVESKEPQDQIIFHNLIKYCLTSFDKIISLRDKIPDFNNHIACQLAQMFVENSIIARKINKSEVIGSNSLITVSAIKNLFKTMQNLKEFGDFSAFSIGFIPLARSLSQKSKVSEAFEFIVSYPAPDDHMLQYTPEIYDALIDIYKQQTLDSVKLSTNGFLKWVEHINSPQIISKFTHDVITCITRTMKSISQRQSFDSLRQTYDCLKIIGIGQQRALIYQDKDFKAKILTEDGIKIELKEKSTQMPIYISADILSNLFLSMDANNMQICNKIIEIICDIIIAFIPSEFSVDTICEVINRIKKGENININQSKLKGSKLVTSMSYTSAEKLIKCFYYYMRKYYKNLQDSSKQKGVNKFKETKVWKIFSFLCHHFGLLYLYKNGNLHISQPDEINPICFITTYKDISISDSKINVVVKVMHEIIKFYNTLFEKDNTIWGKLEIIDVFVESLIDFIEYIGLRNNVREGLQTVFLLVNKFIKWLGIDFMAKYQIKIITSLFNLSIYFPPYAFEYQHQIYEKKMSEIITKFEARNATEVRKLLLNYMMSSNSIGRFCQSLITLHAGLCGKTEAEYLVGEKIPEIEFHKLYRGKQYTELAGRLRSTLFLINNGLTAPSYDTIFDELLKLVASEARSYERCKESIPKDKFNIFAQGQFYSFIEKKIIYSNKNQISSKTNFEKRPEKLFKTFKTHCMDIVKELFPRANSSCFYYDKKLYKLYAHFSKRVKVVKYCLRIIATNQKYLTNNDLCTVLLKLITRDEKALYVEASKYLSNMFQKDYKGTLARDEIQHFFFNNTVPSAKKEECVNPPIIYCRNLRRLMKVCKYNKEIYSQKLLDRLKKFLSLDIGPEQLICIRKLLYKDSVAFSSMDFKDVLIHIINKAFQSSLSFKITESELSLPILKLMKSLPDLFSVIILEKYEGYLFDYLTDLIYKHSPKELIESLSKKLTIPEDITKDGIPSFCGMMKVIYIIIKTNPHKSENYLPLKKYIDALYFFTRKEFSVIPPLQYCQLKLAYKHVEMLCIIVCSLHMDRTDCLFESVRMSFFYLDFDVTLIRKFFVGKYEYGNRIKAAAPEIDKPINPEIHKKIILDTIQETQKQGRSSTDHQIYCITMILLPHLNELRKEGEKYIDETLLDAIINYSVKKQTPSHIQRRLMAAIAIVIPFLKGPDDVIFECLWNNVFYDERTSPKAWSLLGCCLMRKHELSKKLEDPQQVNKLFTLFSSLMRELMFRHQDIIFEAIDIIMPFIFQEKKLADFPDKLCNTFKSCLTSPIAIESSIKIITIYEKQFTPFSNKILPTLWRCFTKLQQTTDNPAPRKGYYFNIYKSLNEAAKTMFNWIHKEPKEGKPQIIANIIQILGKAAMKVWEEKENPDSEVINESYKFQAQFHYYSQEFQDSDLPIESILKEITKCKPTSPSKNLDKDIYYKLTFLNLCIALSYRCANSATVTAKLFEAVLPYLEFVSTLLQNPKQTHNSITLPQKQIEIINAFYHIYAQLQSEKYSDEMENELYNKIKRDFDFSKECTIEVNNEIKTLKEKYNKPGPTKPYPEAINELMPNIYKMVPHIAIKLFPIFIQSSKNKERMKEYMSCLIETFKNLVDILPTLRCKKEEEKEVWDWLKSSDLYILIKSSNDIILKEQVISLISHLSSNIDKLEEKKMQADFIQNACKLARQCEKTRCPEFMIEVIKIIKTVLNDKQSSDNWKAIRDHVLQALREIEYLGTPELEKEVFNCVFELIKNQTEQNVIFDYIKNPMSLLKYKSLLQRQKFYQLNEKQFGTSIVKKFETIFVYMSHTVNTVAKDFPYWYLTLSLDLLLHNIDDTQKLPRQSWMLPRVNEENYMTDTSTLKDKINKHASKLRSIKERNVGTWIKKMKKILVQSLCDYSNTKERLSLAYHSLFCIIFQQYWALLKPNEMQYINSLAEKFIMMQANFLNFNSVKKLSMLKNMLEVFTCCTPYMKFSPELIQHVGKLNGSWHNTALFLESQAIAFPQNERYYYSLNEIYNKLGETDYKLGLTIQATSSVSLTTALTHYSMGRYDTAKSLFTKILSSSEQKLGDAYDIHSYEPSASAQIAKNTLEVSTIGAIRQLSQWNNLKELMAQCPCIRISGEYAASQFNIEAFNKIEKDLSLLYEPLIKVLKLLTCPPKDLSKFYNDALSILLFDCQCNNPGQFTHAHFSYLNCFQMGVDYYDFQQAKDKLKLVQNSAQEFYAAIQHSLRKNLAECESFANVNSILLFRNRILETLEIAGKDGKTEAFDNFIMEETSLNFLKLCRIARKRNMESLSWKILNDLYTKGVHSQLNSNSILMTTFYKEYSKLSSNSAKVTRQLDFQFKSTSNSEYLIFSTEHLIKNRNFQRAENEFNNYLEQKSLPCYKQWKLLFLLSHQSNSTDSVRMEAIGLAKALAFKPSKHIQYVPYLITKLKECVQETKKIEASLKLCPPWIWIFWLPQLIFFEDERGNIIDTTIEKYKWVWIILNRCAEVYQNAFTQPLYILKEMCNKTDCPEELHKIYAKLCELVQQSSPNQNLYSNAALMLNSSFTGMMQELSKLLENQAYEIITSMAVDKNLKKYIYAIIDQYMLLSIQISSIKDNIILMKKQIYEETVHLDLSSVAGVIQFLLKWSSNIRSFIDMVGCQGIEDLEYANIFGAELFGYYTTLYEEPFGCFLSYANNIILHCIHKYSDGARFILSCTNGKYFEYSIQFTTSSINEWKSLQTRILLNYYISHHYNTKSRFLKYYTPITAFCLNMKATNVKVDTQEENCINLHSISNFMAIIQKSKAEYCWVEEYLAQFPPTENSTYNILMKMKEIFPPSSLAHYIHRTISSYEDLFLFRRQVTYSWASNSFLQYIFSTFAERTKNITIAMSKGKIVLDEIDLTKKHHSQIPFRLGKSTQYFINPIGIKGPFRLGIISLAEMIESHYSLYSYKGIGVILSKTPDDIMQIQNNVRQIWNPSEPSELEFSQNIDQLIKKSTEDSEIAKAPVYACMWV